MGGLCPADHPPELKAPMTGSSSIAQSAGTATDKISLSCFVEVRAAQVLVVGASGCLAFSPMAPAALLALAAVVARVVRGAALSGPQHVRAGRCWSGRQGHALMVATAGVATLGPLHPQAPARMATRSIRITLHAG